jgi:iron complex transport system substrate-binding protein
MQGPRNRIHGFAVRGARALATALLALVSACGRGDPAPGDLAQDPAPAAAPRRIVPASATAVDLVAALVPPARIAGFPEQALEYSVLHDPGPELAETPTFFAYLAEPVLALEPDLVVIDAVQSPDTTQRLRSIGVRVLTLPEVGTWSDAISIVGDEVGEPEAARELIAALDARVAALEARAAERPELTGLSYSNFGGAGYTAGSGTTIHAMFELAGLRNLVAERGSRAHPGMTFEELLALDPDVIVVSDPLKMPEGPTGDRGGASAKLLFGEPSLAGLRAVRERRVVALPAWLYATSSYELVHAAEELSRELDALLARLADGRDAGNGR